MSWLILTCGHRLLTIEREEEGNVVTSDYCSECGMNYAVVDVVAGDGQVVTGA